MWIAVIFAALLLVGPACSGAVGPGAGFDRCNERMGVAVCLQQEAYQGGGEIRVAVVNRSDRPLFLDMCSGGIQALSSSGVWRRLSARLCAHADRPEVIRAHMRPLDPGDGLLDSFSLAPLALTRGTSWRTWARILDVGGEPISEDPFTSPEFEALPPPSW